MEGVLNFSFLIFSKCEYLSYVFESHFINKAAKFLPKSKRKLNSGLLHTHYAWANLQTQIF